MKNPNPPEIHHPSADNTPRFAVDQLLRAHGFTIAERASGMLPQWLKGGLIYNQHQALNTLDPRRVEDAYYIEELRREGWPE